MESGGGILFCREDLMRGGGSANEVIRLLSDLLRELPFTDYTTLAYDLMISKKCGDIYPNAKCQSPLSKSVRGRIPLSFVVYTPMGHASPVLLL